MKTRHKKMDFPTILGISTVSILCIFAISMAVLGAENNTNNQDLTDSLAMEKEYERYAETTLSKINQQGITYQKNEHEEKFKEQMTLMQQKQKEIASHYLEINIDKIYLKENYNFPFRDASEIISLDIPSQKPVCDIPPKIPIHLQTIQNSDLFLRFSEKYSQYPITFEMSDERIGNSWVHYALIATSEDENFTASTFFHVDSCTGEILEEYNLNCRDIIQNDSIRAITKNEVISSLEDDEFCTIYFEPWKQALYDYFKIISEKKKKHMEKHETISNIPNNYEAVKDFEYEMERLGRLGNIVGYAMNRDFEDHEFQKMMKEYANVFGDLPDEFLKLIKVKK